MRTSLSHDEQIHRDDSPIRGGGRAPFWAGFGILAAAIVAIAWFGLRDHGARLNEIPGLRTSLSAVSAQLSQLTEKVRSWDEQNFDGRLRSIERGLESKFQAARAQAQKQAQDAAQLMAARLRGEMNARTQGVETRLADLERQSEQDRTQLARLQGELSRVRQELGQQQTRIDAVAQNASADKRMLESNIATVRNDAAEGQNEFNDFRRGLEMRRLGFEINKGRSLKVADGIWIGITGTDRARRQVKGWMWIMPDRKTLWLRDQNALEPVVFYSGGDGKRREVVFTHVTANSAVGYILMPSGVDVRPEVASSSGS